MPQTPAPERQTCKPAGLARLNRAGLRTRAKRRRPTFKRSGAPASDPVDYAAVEGASLRGQADGHDVVCERDTRGELDQADVVVYGNTVVIGVA